MEILKAEIDKLRGMGENVFDLNSIDSRVRGEINKVATIPHKTDEQLQQERQEQFNQTRDHDQPISVNLYPTLSGDEAKKVYKKLYEAFFITAAKQIPENKFKGEQYEQFKKFYKTFKKLEINN